MKFSREIPPIYQRCKETFGVDWNKGLILTYGDTVYSKEPISLDLEVHEGTHIEQQAKMGVENWWDLYFSNPEFRLHQEVEAYTRQFKWIKKNVKDRNLVARLHNHIINSMVNNYGDMCTREQAKKWIQ